MVEYIIIETQAGLTVARQQAGADPLATAAGNGGILIDAGPYSSLDQATDAMASPPVDAKEERSE